jgi:dihydroxy-acid dehydratase
VGLIGSDLTVDRIVTRASLENALRVLLAVGGSTNAVVHLAALAGRLGLDVPLDLLNRLSDETPVLVDLKPTGEHYMEDFHAAGGVPTVLRRLAVRLHRAALTVTGDTLGDWITASDSWSDPGIVRALDNPIQGEGGLVALFGSLAPAGAVLKRAAAEPALFEREGPAVVFTSLEDLARRIDDPALDVTPDDFLVLQNAGPKACGMPEAGYLPIPAKVARAGVKDMVRISDARMSGTAFGTVVLHVSPEAAAGGPLGLVRSGDRIRLSVEGRRLELLVPEDEMARRRAAFRPERLIEGGRGWAKLYREHVLGPEQGCDLDFLRAATR